MTAGADGFMDVEAIPASKDRSELLGAGHRGGKLYGKRFRAKQAAL